MDCSFDPHIMKEILRQILSSIKGGECMQTMTSKKVTPVLSCGHFGTSRLELPQDGGHRVLCARCAQQEMGEALVWQWQNKGGPRS